MVVPENVDRVIKTLERRFGRPELIVESLIAKIQATSTPKEDDFEALIEFADAIQNLSTTLDTLKCDNHGYNPQLIKEVIAKLPGHLRLDWARHLATKTTPANLKELAQWLEAFADAACLVSTPKTTQKAEAGRAKKQTEKQADKRPPNKKKETVLATTEAYD